jgi:hypothetical protein
MNKKGVRMSAKQMMLIPIWLVCFIGQIFAYDEVCGIWLKKGTTYVEKTFTAPSNQIAHFEYFGPTFLCDNAYFKIIDLTVSEVVYEIKWPTPTGYYYDDIWIIENHQYKVLIYDTGVNANRRPWAIVKYTK